MEKEPIYRFVFFLGILVVMAFAEWLFPKRHLTLNRTTRWKNNLLLVLVDTLIVRISIPFTAASVALYAQQNHIGLFHVLSIPFIWSVIIGVVLLDLLIYVQHVLFHFTPLLWRFHKVHHIDQDIDVTTGVRFHPIEILLSTFIKCGVILLLGCPVMAVIIFEILLNAAAMFNHSNINLPVSFDKYLRLILVTPDMHRIHHSVIPSETNRNFGFCLPWWDRLCRTYQSQPQHGHLNMTIGLKSYSHMTKASLTTLLAIPFYRKNN